MSVTKKRQLDKVISFERLNQTEHATKTVTAPTPMEIDAFQGNCHKCGNYGHTAKECRSFDLWRSRDASMCVMWKRNIMDSVGHVAAHHLTKTHRKEDGKATEKENGKGTGKLKGGKGGNQGKGKGEGKKGQRLNEITEPPEEQWTGGSWEEWSEQSWNAEVDAASRRDDDWYTADSSSQTSAAAEEFQHASTADLRLSNFGFVTHTLNLFSMTDWILHSELSHLVLIPLHAKLCVQNCRPRQSA